MSSPDPILSSHPAHYPQDHLDIDNACQLTSNEGGSTYSQSNSPKGMFGSASKCAGYRSGRMHLARPDNLNRTNSTPGNMSDRRRDVTPGHSGSAPTYQNQTPHHILSYEQYQPLMPAPYGPLPYLRGGSLMSENSVPLSSVCPGSVFPSDAQLNTAYGYGIQRNDGGITRLLPADQLADIYGVPARQGPEGLIILPAPRQVSPRRRVGPEAIIGIDVSINLCFLKPSSSNIGPSATTNP